MGHTSGVHRVTEVLADATGRSEDEERLALALAVAGVGVHVAVRALQLLGNLGVKTFAYVASR